MTSRDHFLAALNCQPLERPPLWVMRQAGRYLPEYRALKAKSSFLEMVKTPALAAEVTLQPLHRFALDGAILFSDILVIPEALGQPYAFRDTGGIAMSYRLETRAQIDALAPAHAVPEKLAYVADTLALLKKELTTGADPRIAHKALLGFGGSPWTLATYMVEGGSSDDFERIKLLFYTDRATFDALLEKLTAALIAYFQMQIRAGADAIQMPDRGRAARRFPDHPLRERHRAPADRPVLLRRESHQPRLDPRPRHRPPQRPRQHRPPGQPRPRAHADHARDRPPRNHPPPRIHARHRRPHLQPRPRHHPRRQDRVHATWKN